MLIIFWLLVTSWLFGKKEKTGKTNILVHWSEVYIHMWGRTFFLEFIGVTLVNKVSYVLGVQFYNKSSVHYTVRGTL